MRAQIKGPQGRERVRVAGAGPGSDAISPAEDETCMRPQPLTPHWGWQLERGNRGPGVFLSLVCCCVQGAEDSTWKVVHAQLKFVE